MAVGPESLLVLLVAVWTVHGTMLDIVLTRQKGGAFRVSDACKSLGYDGLAVLSTPEAFAQALQMSERIRTEERTGFYIGLMYHKNTSILAWQDGTLPAVDLPLMTGEPPSNLNRFSHASVFFSANIKMVTGTHGKYGVCGNHRAPHLREMRGSTIRGHQPSDYSLILSESDAHSYLGCVQLCSKYILCRVAEFNSDLKVCTVIGPSGGANVTVRENPFSTTFVRIGFQDTS